MRPCKIETLKTTTNPPSRYSTPLRAWPLPCPTGPLHSPKASRTSKQATGNSIVFQQAIPNLGLNLRRCEGLISSRALKTSLIKPLRASESPFCAPAVLIPWRQPNSMYEQERRSKIKIEIWNWLQLLLVELNWPPKAWQGNPATTPSALRSWYDTFVTSSSTGHLCKHWSAMRCSRTFLQVASFSTCTVHPKSIQPCVDMNDWL